MIDSPFLRAFFRRTSVPKAMDGSYTSSVDVAPFLVSPIGTRARDSPRGTTEFVADASVELIDETRASRFKLKRHFVSYAVLF